MLLKDLGRYDLKVSDLQTELKKLTDLKIYEKTASDNIEKETDYYRRISEDLSVKLQNKTLEYSETIGKKEEEIKKIQQDKRVGCFN